MSSISLLSLYLSTVTCFYATFDNDTSPNSRPGVTSANVASISSAQRLPSGWMHSFEAAQAAAQRSGKPLVVHFEASWCSACVRMEREVLGNYSVTNLLGDAVVGVKVDADQRRDLIESFGISTLPTEVVVRPDGGRQTYVGATGLTSYISRLNSLRSLSRSTVQPSSSGQPKAAEKQKIQQASATTNSAAAKAKPANTRQCIIVTFDGKMVGNGGYSPVVLSEQRKWLPGTREHVTEYEGVCYFFQTASELRRFEAEPGKFIPRLHGCDPVALFDNNRLVTGALEYGSFYRGRLFFFASLENRDRFESNPSSFSTIVANDKSVSDEDYPFVK